MTNPQAVTDERLAGFEEFANQIVRDVAELPDRDSPDDWPEAMIVTDAELRAIITERLASRSQDGQWVETQVKPPELGRWCWVLFNGKTQFVAFYLTAMNIWEPFVDGLSNYTIDAFSHWQYVSAPPSSRSAEPDKEME